jgi:hypothetical protein
LRTRNPSKSYHFIHPHDPGRRDNRSPFLPCKNHSPEERQKNHLLKTTEWRCRAPIFRRFRRFRRCRKLRTVFLKRNRAADSCVTEFIFFILFYFVPLPRGLLNSEPALACSNRVAPRSVGFFRRWVNFPPPLLSIDLAPRKRPFCENLSLEMVNNCRDLRKMTVFGTCFPDSEVAFCRFFDNYEDV